MRENMKDGSKTKKWNAMICQLLNNYFQSNLILVTFDGLNNGLKVLFVNQMIIFEIWFFQMTILMVFF